MSIVRQRDVADDVSMLTWQHQSVTCQADLAFSGLSWHGTDLTHGLYRL
jgi:hypothetical protein